MSRIKDNALSLTFLVLFLLSLAGQALAGMLHYNEQQLVEGGEAVSFLTYMTSSSFAVDARTTVRPSSRKRSSAWRASGYGRTSSMNRSR